MSIDTPDRTRRLLLSVPLLAASSRLLAAGSEHTAATSVSGSTSPFDKDRMLLLKNADVVVTMDASRREIHGGSVLIKGTLLPLSAKQTRSHRWLMK